MLQWPVDKLTLINSALSQTGDNLVNVLEDGSDEYTVCGPAYERAIGILLEEHAYGFGTKVATLTPSPTAPANTDWDTNFVLPADLIHIIWVKSNQNTGDPLSNQINLPILYAVEAGFLVVNAQGGPPPPDPAQTPAIITMKYVSSDNSDVQAGTPLFVAALQCFVMSGIYRGLHGDPKEATNMWQGGELFAQRARTRYDQQMPKRQFWNSRMQASRRVRRPWPQQGIYNWSGSGTPG